MTFIDILDTLIIIGSIISVYFCGLCCLIKDKNIISSKPYILNRRLNRRVINLNPLIINTECCICLREYSDDKDIVQLPCQHIFHKECIYIWFLKKSY